MSCGALGGRGLATARRPEGPFAGRWFCLGLLAWAWGGLAPVCWAGAGIRAGVMVLTNRVASAAFGDVSSAGVGLRPRLAHPKGPLVQPPGRRHRLTVKFADGVRARAIANGHLSFLGGEIPAGLAPVIERYCLRLKPVYDDAGRMEWMCRRAAERSGRQQPDMNGTMRVEIFSRADVMAVARALHSLECVESVDIESVDVLPPPPGDISPPTPNLESLQAYRGANPGHDADYARARGADGAGVRYSDCEYAYDPSHEDLVDAGIVNRSRAPFDPIALSYDDHGTAVLGISQAPNNGYGISGIAPRATGAFYSEYTTAGQNREGAIEDAIADSDVGDVILLEMQTTGAGGGYVPAEYSSAVWNKTKIATDSGIIVVAAAGNGNQDLDGSAYTAYRARGDSGAIIVGAGSATTAHSKVSYSTYGARVNVQAWGESVATTGYGTYARYGNDDRQSYRSDFNGTSSASACVAGVVCAIQSYAIARLGTRLDPGEMRELLQATGHGQGGSGGHIGPAVTLCGALNALPAERLCVKSCAVVSVVQGDVTISFVGIPFRSYRIEASPDMKVWSTLESGIVASVGLTSRTMDGAANGHARRFFRVAEETSGEP